jgi:hypothetical protein
MINLYDFAFVERCILLLHDQQTPLEQRVEKAINENSAGFSGSNARYGTYLARWIKLGNHLSDKHLKSARGICITHAKQIIKILNQES